jgi:hypothetical protein
MLLRSFNIPLEFGDGFPLTLGTVPQKRFFFKQIFLEIVPWHLSNFSSDDAEFYPLTDSAKKSQVSLLVFEIFKVKVRVKLGHRSFDVATSTPVYP